MSNLTIIGSSHIAKESVQAVKKFIEEEKPDIIAVELDKQRAIALMTNQKASTNFLTLFRVGLKGWLFALIGSFVSKKLGEIVGVEPGAEMKMALTLAKKQKATIAFIDQNIQITLKRFSETLSWKERWNFVVDILTAVFNKKKAMAELEGFDIKSVPADELVERLVNKVKKRYPNIHNVLIEERNRIMARNLTKIIAQNPDKNILAVMGAGHVKDVKKLMGNMEAVPAVSYSFNVSI